MNKISEYISKFGHKATPAEQAVFSNPEAHQATQEDLNALNLRLVKIAFERNSYHAALQRIAQMSGNEAKLMASKAAREALAEHETAP